MDERMLHALEAQRNELHSRWEALLRVEPVITPLGQPEALKHMIDFTLKTLFTSLHTAHSQRKKHLKSVREWAADRSLCPCGKNPLMAYFVAGEQALLETLILVQAGLPDCAETRATAVYELKLAMAHVAHREIETFCALCQLRSQNGGTGSETHGAHGTHSHGAHHGHGGAHATHAVPHVAHAPHAGNAGSQGQNGFPV
jgi:hypothetical protein